MKSLEKRIDSYDTAKDVDLPQEGTLEAKDIVEAIKNLQLDFESKMVDQSTIKNLEEQIAELQE